MTRQSVAVCLSLFALVGSASISLRTGLSAQNGQNAAATSHTFSTRVVTTGLEGPWELSWGPDGWLWVTERTGKRVDEDKPRGRIEGCRADDSRRAPERRAGRPARHGAPS